MLEIIMILYTLYTMMEIYIAIMQIGYVAQEKGKEAVLMSPERYQKAAEYAIKKGRIGLVSTVMDYILFVWWVTVGFAWLSSTLHTGNTVWDAVVFLFGFATISFIVGLPMEIYTIFELDKAYGFSKMTPKLYLQDKLKGLGLFVVFGGAIFALLAWIVIHVEHWWIWGFVLLFTVALLANVIYPLIIVPLFNKLSPLEDGTLKEEIESMMQGAGLKSDGVFVMDAGKRDTRLNAYFGGLGKSKRVVLFDTLIEKLTHKELLAVLGHELGHFSHGDIWKNIAMMGVLLFSVFFFFGNLPDTLFYAMGVERHAGVEIAMIMLLLPLVSFVFTPIMSFVSRHNEYAADTFGSELGGKENLVSALIKLVDENKAFPKSHPLVVFFHFTHPPVLERLKALGYDATAINEMSQPLPKDGIFTFINDEQK